MWGGSSVLSCERTTGGREERAPQRTTGGREDWWQRLSSDSKSDGSHDAPTSHGWNATTATTDATHTTPGISNISRILEIKGVGTGSHNVVTLVLLVVSTVLYDSCCVQRVQQTTSKSDHSDDLFQMCQQLLFLVLPQLTVVPLYVALCTVQVLTSFFFITSSPSRSRCYLRHAHFSVILCFCDFLFLVFVAFVAFVVFGG